MPPERILIIRHGEEHGEAGVDENGAPEKHSLTVRGWQRASALVRFFAPRDAGGDLAPDAIFASRIGEGSETRRPQQTATPLAAMLSQVPFVTTHLKTEVPALMADVLGRSGTVLIVWEHSMIPACVNQLPNPPAVPGEWPKTSYDLVWILDRAADGWTFVQREQELLADGSDDP